MKVATMFGILYLSVFLDTAVLVNYPIFGATASLTLISVLCMGILNGRFSGGMCGLCAGILMDLLIGPTFGFYALILLLVGYFGTWGYQRVLQANSIMPAIYIAVAYLGYELVTAACGLLIGMDFFSGGFAILIHHVLPSARLTGIVAIPGFGVLRFLFSAQFMKKKSRMNMD